MVSRPRLALACSTAHCQPPGETEQSASVTSKVAAKLVCAPTSSNAATAGRRVRVRASKASSPFAPVVGLFLLFVFMVLPSSWVYKITSLLTENSLGDGGFYCNVSTMPNPFTV